MAHLMPMPLTISCFSKIQIGFTFLIPAHLGSPRKGLLNRCVRACVLLLIAMSYNCRCMYVRYMQLNSTCILTYSYTNYTNDCNTAANDHTTNTFQCKMIFDDQLAMAKKVQDRTEVAGITVDQEGTIFILHTPQLHLSTTTYFLHNVIAEAASMTFVPLDTRTLPPIFFRGGTWGWKVKCYAVD